MGRLITVCLLLAALPACDEPELAGEGEPCERQEDCRGGLDCYEGLCTELPECAEGREPCGLTCCRADQRCVEGACELHCTSGIQCGEGCCTSDESCIDGVCCGPDLLCGETCCRADETCVDGACVTCPRELCGGRQCCRDWETCHEGTCCSAASICGPSCCGEDEVCELGACRPDCGAGDRCGSPEVCCGAFEVCYLDRCLEPGPACGAATGCGATEHCEPDLGRCMPLAETAPCEHRPPRGEFEPVVAWRWTGGTTLPEWRQVDMAPVVANLNDDDGDGRVDDSDVPDVVFSTFRAADGLDGMFGGGVLRAVSGEDGAELFVVADPSLRVNAAAGIAVADIDGDGLPEILTCGGGPDAASSPLLAFSNQGALEWRTDDPRVRCGASAPAIGDVDGDGSPEILVRYTLVDATGAVLWSGASGEALAGADSFTVLADVDDEPGLEIVGGNRVYDGDGTLLFHDEDPAAADGFPAVADLDGDGDPDLVVVSSVQGWAVGDYPVPGHWIYARDLGAGGALLWGPFDLNQGRPTPDGPGGGGPPVVADLDGDGLPEVGTAGGYGYAAFDGATGAPLWFVPSSDLGSRATGSAAFDFEGDGAAEVIFVDEQALRICDGASGAVLFEVCSASLTLFQLPVVADVDGDGRAELLAVSDDMPSSSCADGLTSAIAGVTLFEDALDNWVRTRPIWNQHGYHVTNVEPDGTIPAVETRHWAVPELNGFRRNLLVEGLLDAPDLAAADLRAARSECPGALILSARVVNRGAAAAPAGVAVAFVRAGEAEEQVGLGRTSMELAPGASQLVASRYELLPGEAGVALAFRAVVDPGEELVRECDEDDNVSEVFEGFCPLAD